MSSHLNESQGDGGDLSSLPLRADAKLKLKYAADGTDRQDKLAIALRKASIGKLKAHLAKRIEALDEDAALRLGEELTSRGIPPCFRGNFSEDEHLLSFWGGVEPLLLLLDLQWIASRYPDQKPEWQRLKPLFVNTKKLRELSTYLYWGGRRAAGQIARALALTEAQQLECAWVQCLHVERRRHGLFKRLPITQSIIIATVRKNDKRPMIEQDATIERRSNLWLCAELASWKPQRTAEMYQMMTGKTLPRNLVANQLAKLPKVRRGDPVIVL
jgi:hypothetical protein